MKSDLLFYLTRTLDYDVENNKAIFQHHCLQGAGLKKFSDSVLLRKQECSGAVLRARKGENLLYLVKRVGWAGGVCVK